MQLNQANEGAGKRHDARIARQRDVAKRILVAYNGSAGALANAGVALQSDLPSALGHRVSLGIIVGLVLGKPIGILLLSWAALPEGVNWRHIFGIGMLAGIGFTMSLFVANQAFGIGPLLSTAKVGILIASLVSGMCGGLFLLATSLRRVATVRPTFASIKL